MKALLIGLAICLIIWGVIWDLWVRYPIESAVGVVVMLGVFVYVVMQGWKEASSNDEDNRIDSDRDSARGARRSGSSPDGSDYPNTDNLHRNRRSRLGDLSDLD